MSLKNIVFGSTVASSDLNNNFSEFLTLTGLNTIRQLIDRNIVWSAGELDGWGEAYIDANGQENSVSNASAEFNSNHYRTTTTFPYIIIEATSLTIGDFSINNCTATLISSGKWILTCDTGTDEVKRAQLYKTLFYGTNGTDGRGTDTYITSLTALKTSVTRDVGKRAYFATITKTSNVFTDEGFYEGTFNDTFDNNDCSAWSNCSASGSGSGTAAFQFPTGITVNSVGVGSANSEIGTDVSGDEDDNPAACRIIYDINSSDTKTLTAKSLVLCFGSISWSLTTTSGTPATTSLIDFNTGSGMVSFTAVADADKNLIIHDIPSGTFSATISDAIGVSFVHTFETGANIQFKLLNGSDDSGWLDAMNTEPELSTFSAFSSEPTKLIVKLIPKSSAPTANTPAIRGFWVRAT